MAENTERLATDRPDRASLEVVGTCSTEFGSIRYNEMSCRVEVNAKTSIRHSKERPLDFNGLVTCVYDRLQARGFKGGTLKVVEAYLIEWAKDDSYHPVRELLENTQWDSADRLPEVYSILGIEKDLLSMSLVRKWLLQAIALLHNTLEAPFGGEGVLVLNGAQGAGKTSFFRHLALRPEWFLEGAAIKDSDKDTTRRAVTHWITELGELETTMKSDVSALKAWITSAKDSYRLPYARTDTETPRTTSLCATCNSDRFLVDTTGNRRYWTIPIEHPIGYDRIQALDALQLWAQMYAVYTALDATERQHSFRLTSSEQQQLAKRNGYFEKPIKAETECRDILEAAEANPYIVWRVMTPTEWKEEQLTLRSYSADQIGKALQKIGLHRVQRRIPGKASPIKGYELPTATAEILPFSKEGRG